MSWTLRSADAFDPLDFCRVLVPFGQYDEPEILLCAEPAACPTDADVKQKDDESKIAKKCVLLPK